MTQKIYRTKRYAAAGLVASGLYLYLITKLLNDPVLSAHPVIVKLAGILNLSLLVAAFFLFRCLILMFRKRIVLQAGEKGLYLQVSRKNRGVVPWRHIAYFECTQDSRQIRIYLQGLWDIPDDCGERFDIQLDENRQRMIVLPLRYKVHGPERVCAELEEWWCYYSDGGRTHRPEMDERAQRRAAAAQKQAASSLLVPLYFIRAKFWLLAIVGYLFFAAWIETLADLPRPAVLIVAVIPALLISFLIRRLLSKIIYKLERRKEEKQERMVGL